MKKALKKNLSFKLTNFFAVLIFFVIYSHNADANIFLSHDINTFGNLAAGIQEEKFAVNVAKYLTSDSATKDLLLFESNPGDPTRNFDHDVLNALFSAGFDVTVTPNYATPFSGYDAIFVAENFPTVGFLDNNLLIDYANNGGGVYLAGGTGSHLIPSAPATEAAGWDSFLNYYGLGFEDNYNGIFNVPITSADPVFSGITSLNSGNGQSIVDLGTNSKARIIQTFQGENIYAKVDVDRTNAVPEPSSMFLLGSGILSSLVLKKNRKGASVKLGC